MAAAALLASGAALVTAPAASAAPVTVTGGTIDWGVKTSFRNYISGPIAHGTITADGGATLTSGVFHFPVSTGAYDTVDGAAADGDSAGSVHFLGHDGILDVLIEDVRVDISSAGAFVVADVTSKEFINTTTSGPSVLYNDVKLVSLDLTGVTPTVGTDTVTYTNVPAELTADGVPAFGGFYPAGNPADPNDNFDPVSFTLNLQPAAPAQPDGLTWKVSQYAFTLTSLIQAREAGAPAVLDTDGADLDGYRFPVTSASYDPSTGVGDVQYSGSLTLGNTSQGNYRIKFADPRLLLNGDGTGSLEADPSYCIGATNCGTPSLWTSGTDVTLLTFAVGASDITDSGDHVSAVFTPNWASVGNSFDAELISFLPSNLQAHFRATGSNPTNDANKPGAVLNVEFDYTPPPPVGVDTDIDISTTVEPGGLTISVPGGDVVLPTPTLTANGNELQTTGDLGGVQVTDTRATDPGWNVTAQLTDFTGSAGTVDAEGLGWTPRVTSSSVGQTVTAGGTRAPGVGIGGAQLGSAASGAGLGTAVLDADLDLRLPTNTAPGTYTATLTLTAI